jgi:hypothetical protein
LKNVGTIKTLGTLGWDKCILLYEIDMSHLGARIRMLWFKEMCLIVKLTRGRLVMVNLDINLIGLRDTGDQ